MATYIFAGKVFPERADVNIQISPIEVQIKEAGLQFQARISIGASQVSVVVDTEEEVSELSTLRNYIEWYVGVAVNALGYLGGRGYDVEITSVVGSSGTPWHVFGVGVPALERSKSERPVNFSGLWNLLMSDERAVPLERALANLREAIRAPHDTALFCHRAIESLRQMFGDASDDDTKPSWKRMGASLRVERSWIGPLIEPGQQLRHGEPRFSSGAERETFMLLTWKVIDRFIEYARGGYKPLPEAGYPLLQ